MEEFANVPVGKHFLFPGKEKRYTKVEEIKRPYTPEAYSNAVFDWVLTDPRTNTKLSEGQTFFYVDPTTMVVPE